jgi:hypothetical protein
MFKKVWGRRLVDAARERRLPNAARTKHVPQTLDPALFGGRFGGRDWRCSKDIAMVSSPTVPKGCRKFI